MSEILRPQLVSTSSQTRSVRSMSPSVSFSSSARVTVVSMSAGLSPRSVTNGTFTWVVSRSESAIFARSAASAMRCQATRSPWNSTPCFSLNRRRSSSTSARSKSTPPRKVSPPVEMTS